MDGGVLYLGKVRHPIQADAPLASTPGSRLHWPAGGVIGGPKPLAAIHSQFPSAQTADGSSLCAVLRSTARTRSSTYKQSVRWCSGDKAAGGSAPTRPAGQLPRWPGFCASAVPIWRTTVSNGDRLSPPAVLLGNLPTQF